VIAQATVLAGITLIASLQLEVKVLRHDQNVAARKALAFAKAAILEQDFEAAHGMVREEDQKEITKERLEEVVKSGHPTGRPTELRAIEFEPVPGQPAIQIFLMGKNDKEMFYYRVPVVGTVTDGYFPQGLFRGSGPYPQTALRQKLRLPR
jgi:hypothetical protein